MSTMETCQVCKKTYVPETRKYKLDGFLEANKICDNCFETVMRCILSGGDDYCIHQKMELKPMDLTDEERKMLKSAEKITILQAGKIRKLSD